MTQSSMHLPPLRQGRKAWHTEAADTRRAERQPGPEPPWGRCCAARSRLVSTHGFPGLGDGQPAEQLVGPSALQGQGTEAHHY